MREPTMSDHADVGRVSPATITMGMEISLAREELRRLTREATPGPLFVHPEDLVGGWCVTNVDAPPSSGARSIGTFVDRSDAQLACAMRNALPALLDTLDRQDAEIERLQQSLKDEYRRRRRATRSRSTKAAELIWLRSKIRDLRWMLESCAGFIAGCRDDSTAGEWRYSKAHHLQLEITDMLEEPTDVD